MTKKTRRNANVREENQLDIRLPRDLTSEIFDDLESLIEEMRSRISSDTYPGSPVGADYTKVELLHRSYKSKYVGKDTLPAAERKAKAIEKWLRAEMSNVKTNKRLSVLEARFISGNSKAYTIKDVVRLASRFIRETIGETFPEDILSKGVFTNGASTRLKRDVRNVAKKYLGRPHASSDAAALLPCLVREFPRWNLSNPDFTNPVIQESSMMFTVPKSSEIDRVCCKEPEVNMFMQRACGLYIRKLLQRNGIDLRDQTPNQMLARRGSWPHGQLATIDLSSASDTVSEALVRLLLPADWYMLLDFLRVKSVILPDKSVHQLNMFSSMGNGFTFELETLVFWSLARAVAVLTGTPGRIIVYGDDIIIPNKMAVALKNVLSYCGFTVNASKSFWKGYYRESCGKHFYAGADVTPFFIREPIVNQMGLIHYLNSFRKWCVHTDCGLHYYFGKEFLAHWSKYSTYVMSTLKGGRDLDDICSLVSSDVPSKRLIPLTKKRKNVQAGGLLWWLHRSCEDSEFFTPSTVFNTESSRYGLRRNRTWERTLPVEQMFVWRKGE